MTADLIYYFPRSHTAIAEWIVCILYISFLPKRLKGFKLYAVCAAFFVIIFMTHLSGEKTEGIVWIVLMVLGMLEMLILIFITSKITLVEAGYHWAHAFIVAELAASLEWQINFYLISGGVIQNYNQFYICMSIVYILIFGFTYYMKRHTKSIKDKLRITWKELAAVLVIAFIAFFISNFSFAFRDNIFSQSLGGGILYARTLVDFGGLMLLYAHDAQRQEMNLTYELDAMENMFHRQYEQYKQFEVNNESLHRVYHDLKNQIAFIRAETNETSRNSYIAELEKVISIHEAKVNTGAYVLDTLLTSKNMVCQNSDIVMTCFADAKQLDFIDVMDICSIFGNALDNAIECECKIEDKNKRLIKVNVSRQNRFVLIRIENYCEEQIVINGEIPDTTKKDKQMHGFGVKSIKLAVEKYRGHVVLEQNNAWVTMTALIPLPEQEG